MNLDERSERYNTEVGVMISGPELTNRLLSLVDFESSCYPVELGAAGQNPLGQSARRRGALMQPAARGFAHLTAM